jgi:secretory phospholipase A2
MGRLTPAQAKMTCNAQYRTNSKNGKNPTSNGCGSGWNGPLVPDGGLFWDFGPACDAHDKCYGTCGKSKDACDEAFQMDMRKICADVFMWNFPGPFISCAAQAETYYQAVKGLGEGPFQDAQDEYCEWDDCCLK